MYNCRFSRAKNIFVNFLQNPGKNSTEQTFIYGIAESGKCEIEGSTDFFLKIRFLPSEEYIDSKICPILIFNTWHGMHVDAGEYWSIKVFH